MNDHLTINLNNIDSSKILKQIGCFKIFVFFVLLPFFVVAQSHNSQEEEISTVKLEFIIQNIDIDNKDINIAIEPLSSFYTEAIKRKKYKLAAQSASEMSFIHRKVGLIKPSLFYAKSALHNARKLKDSVLISTKHNNLGTAYLYCANTLEEGNEEVVKYLDSAIVNFEDSEDLISKFILNNSRQISNDAYNSDFYFRLISWSNLASCYYAKDDKEKSLFYAKKAINYCNEYNLPEEDKVEAYNFLGNFHLNESNFKKAEDYYFKASDAIDSIPNFTDWMTKASLLINISYAKYNQGELESYDYLDDGFTYLEKYYQDDKDREISKVINDLDKLNDINAANEAKETLQKFLLLLGLLAVFIIGTLFTLYRATQLKQKNLELQIDKDQLLQKSELERLDKLSQTKVLNATIDGRESERKLIAEILHDSVSSLLSSANLHLQASRSVYDEIPMEIEKSQRIISEASDKIRNLSHELISSVLLKFGLSYSIFDLCEKYSNSQIELVSDINKIQRYDQAFEIKINNIIEELVNNILKHSKASEAIISLEQKGRNLYLEITDNGDGFKLDQAVLKDGLGLNQIKARISMMEGSINIDSEEGLGTTINIEVPIVERPIVKREVV
jgi:signal transduction histidine kinase